MAEIGDPLDDEEEAEEVSVSPRGSRRQRRSDKEIEALYDHAVAPIFQERSDFLLPQIIDLVSKEQWINLRPEYQRRLRWNDEKKSLLIESFLMNVPVPPLFLYEIELNRYEVMDGQQRLVSILDFYGNQLTLKGLRVWPDLNGRTYQECPPRIQRGLDRRRVSAVVLLAESQKPDDDPVKDIRRQVFERLNTGGTALNPQELRNCVFRGKFNDFIIEIAKSKLFNEMIGMPIYEDNERSDRSISRELQNNQLFKTMGDCQLALRFFAFREDKYIHGSVRDMLDRCMRRNLSITDAEIDQLRNEFRDRLSLVHQILGEDAFKLPTPRGPRLSRPLFDAVMIAFDRLWDKRDKLTAATNALRKEFSALFNDQAAYQLVVGKPNTANAVKQRIKLVADFIHSKV